jgi:putative drug exporter of the RND superfamily
MTQRPSSVSDGVPRPAATVRVAMWSARHRVLVLIGWFAVMVGLFGASSVQGTRLQTALSSGDTRTESEAGFDAFEDAGQRDPGESAWFVVSTVDGRITEGPPRQALSSIVGELQGATVTLPGDTESAPLLVNVVDPLTAPQLMGLVSSDGTAALIPARLPGDSVSVDARVTPIRDLVAKLQAEHPEVRLSVLDTAIINQEVGELVTQDLDGSLKLTLPITFIILVLAFGALLAAFVPLVLAVTALLGAFGLIGLYSQAVEPVSQYSGQMVVLIGLAVAVDYSLFLVSRFRSELHAGRSVGEALEVASSTAGRAVFFSGLAVAISLCGLLMIDNSVFRSIAISTICVVIVSVVGSLTFLPATLALLGTRIDALAVPFIGARREGSGIWGRLVGTAIRYPAAVTVLAVAALVIVSIPATRMWLGSVGIDGLPKDLQSVQAWQELAKGWPMGTTLTLDTYVTTADRPDTQAAMADYAARVAQVPGIGRSTGTDRSGDGTVAVIHFTLPGGSNDAANWDVVRQVRRDVVPAAFGGLSDARVYVAGDAASALDMTDMFGGQTPKVIAFVLALSFLLLLIVFRSLVIPVLAIVLTLLSAGVAFGIMQLVFGEGWWDELLDVTASPIQAWVPPLIFTVLFGLAMDYQVFILTRIKEERDGGLGSVEAVTRGILATSGTVTSAAAIMVAVFAVMASLHFVIIKQMGLGLAIAILVDATIVRTLLLPSMLKLLGDRSWWLPRWLDWLPRITIEGEPLPSARPAAPGAVGLATASDPVSR